MKKKPILTGVSETAEECVRAAAEFVCSVCIVLTLQANCFRVNWVDLVRL